MKKTEFNSLNYKKEKDGKAEKLDRDEVAQWLHDLKAEHKTDAEEEANHLFFETLSRSDDESRRKELDTKTLSKEEILDTHELWVGSKSTKTHLDDEL